MTGWPHSRCKEEFRSQIIHSSEEYVLILFLISAVDGAITAELRTYSYPRNERGTNGRGGTGVQGRGVFVSRRSDGGWDMGRLRYIFQIADGGKRPEVSAMQQTTVDTRVGGIIALSEAGEFLLCAVRALAGGAETSGHDVGFPTLLAKEKIEEALAILSGEEGRLT